MISWAQNSWLQGLLTASAFFIGACTSILCGYLGMRVAVYSNVRTTITAMRPGYKDSFDTAMRAGNFMGYFLSSFGIFMLYSVLLVFEVIYDQPSDWNTMVNCVAGFGLGGSSVALFGRVGGGIFTKAGKNYSHIRTI
jgi:H+-translocating diphosphatase